MKFINKHRLFLLLSLLIAVIDASFVLLTYEQAKSQLHAEEQEKANNYFSAFDIAYKATQKNMLQISNIVANEPVYGQLFLKGKRAVEKEGGGAGGHEASLARNALNDAVQSNWKQFSDKFQARQLHFHLGPGSTSFLRVHKPHKFGDNMDNVRYTIVDSNLHQQELTGFETGRVYSGIRGVTPVFAINEVGEREHVGAVEAGTSFYSVFNTITAAMSVDVAVLLYEEHLTRSVWPEYLNTRLESTPPIKDLVIEGTTNDQVNHLRKLAPEHHHNSVANSDISVDVYTLDGHIYLYAKKALRDYIGQTSAAIPDAGQIIIWQDITELYDTFYTNLRVNIYFAIVAFLIVEILVFMGIKLISQHLQAIIYKKTEDISSRARALDFSPDFIAITDKTGKIEYANSKAFDVTAYSPQELQGENMSILRSDNTSDELYEKLWTTILSGKEWRGKFLNKRKDGSFYWAENVISPRIDANGQLVNFIVAQHDVTTAHNQHEKILHDAHHDPLTGLINRRGFEQRVNKIFDARKSNYVPTVLFFLDLDYFKRINDKCGHQAGDQVLQDISKVIEGQLRQTDTLARFGGDEFAVILNQCETEEAMRIAEKICFAIKAYEFSWQNEVYTMGVSVGVTPFLNTDTNWSETINRADEACYDAKKAGRSQVVLIKPQ